MTSHTVQSTRCRVRFFIGFVLIAMVSAVLGISKNLLVVSLPVPSDVILVPSGDFSLRSKRALELARAGYGKQILVDEGANTLTFGRTLAQRRIEETTKWPFPVTVCPVKVDSTFEESRECGPYLLGLGAHRVLIVTSDFHTRRALASFRKTIPTIDFTVASAPTGFSSAHWWSISTASRTLRELGGLLWLKLR